MAAVVLWVLCNTALLFWALNWWQILVPGGKVCPFTDEKSSFEFNFTRIFFDRKSHLKHFHDRSIIHRSKIKAKNHIFHQDTLGGKTEFHKFAYHLFHTATIMLCEYVHTQGPSFLSIIGPGSNKLVDVPRGKVREEGTPHLDR